MPPVENELVESDFDDAVTLKLFLFEHEREQEARRVLAEMIGLEVSAALGAALPAPEVGGY